MQNFINLDVIIKKFVMETFLLKDVTSPYQSTQLLYITLLVLPFMFPDLSYCYGAKNKQWPHHSRGARREAGEVQARFHRQCQREGYQAHARRSRVSKALFELREECV